MSYVRTGLWALSNDSERTDPLEKRSPRPSGLCRLGPRRLAGRRNSIKPRPVECYTVGWKGGILINFSISFWTFKNERVPSIYNEHPSSPCAGTGLWNGIGGIYCTSFRRVIPAFVVFCRWADWCLLIPHPYKLR